MELYLEIDEGHHNSEQSQIDMRNVVWILLKLQDF